MKKYTYFLNILNYINIEFHRGVMQINFLYFIPVFILLLLGILNYIDYKKKRKLKSKPFISFIVPCYNDGKTISNTIKSIYSSYNYKFELITINDKSTDNSLKLLKELKKKYKFKLINNKKNVGKSESINNIISEINGEIIIVVDADTIITKKALNDIIKRFDSDKNVAAVSCPYKTYNEGILATMQNIEYNFLKIIKRAQNPFSVLSLWGGCLAVKKEKFIEVEGFSKNAIVEDVDLALKLNKAGYKVEQSFVSVATDVPNTLKTLFKQKVRWTSGGAQCLITYFKYYLKNPAYLVFALTNLFLLSLFMYYITESFFGITYNYFSHQPLKLLAENIINFFPYIWAIDKNEITKGIFIKFGFMTLSIPYVIMMIKSKREIYKLVYLIPYSFFYSPFYLVTGIYGYIVGIKKYFELKNGEKRGW